MRTQRRDVVVVGASAGGVEALRALVAGLPPDFPAAVLIVLHVPPTSRSALPQILDRAGHLPVRQAAPDDPVEPGHVLVAAPDHHLLVYDGRVTLSHGPRENGHRPAVDVLFRSAARALGPRVVGVVLSGTLDDGTAGLIAVRERGGVGVVQDPEDALHDAMPRSAVAHARPEHVLPLAELPDLLVKLVREEVDAGSAPPPTTLMRMETAVAELDAQAMSAADRPGDPAGLSCPECSGTLFRIEDGGLVRFRCRVGHAWSPESLVAQQAAAMESALWMALRALEERAALSRDMAARARDRGHPLAGRHFGEDHDDAVRAADLLRKLIADMATGGHGGPQEEAGLPGD
jgi:two-component system chemotaxis response regulator CheB